jgi:GABA(A) receptor-associated protein
MSVSTTYSAPGVLQTEFSSSATGSGSGSGSGLDTANTSGLPNDYLERLKKSQVILEKYPDRVPLIVQPSKNDRVVYPIDKSKYITPRDLTMMQLQQIIRKRIRFPPEKALFMFVNNKIFPITSPVGNIYDENKDADGFLYVTYCQENTFG